jgi:acetylornithine deacetylase
VPTDLVALLQQLIRIPSVNPDNDPGTASSGETELADFLAEWLRKLGAATHLEEVKPGRPNLVARFAPLDGRPRVLFGPHLDTVGVGGMTIDPFAAELRDGRIWGRGACDTKGPMAAMLWALQEHAPKFKDALVAVDFVAFMGEESGQWGSRQFVAQHGADYRFAIVGEPTSLDIVHVTKGSLWATLRATGVAAHSSLPEQGDNAILRLLRALDHLDRDLSPRLAVLSHPQLGPSTLNIGVIRGGTRPNIVPDLAEAEIDIRTTPSLAAIGGAMPLLQAAIESAGLDITIVNPHENPPMETDPGLRDIEPLLAARPDTRLVGAPWFSDAAHLSGGGLPSVCLGPGSINQAHTADEFIEVAQLEAGAEQFSAYVAAL